MRGVDAVPATHMLYISYGGNGGTQVTGSLLKYDLLTDTVVWTKNYTHGVDAFTIGFRSTRELDETLELIELAHAPHE